jgi:hypothetical protein
MAHRSLGRSAMRLALYPLVITALAFALALAARTAAASPSTGTSSNAREDALTDGEIDAEDIAAAQPARGTGRRTFVGTSGGSAWLSLVGFSRRTLDDRQETGGFVVVGLPLDRFARVSSAHPIPPAFELAADRGPVDLALSTRVTRACVIAAWRAAGLGIDDSRLDAIVSRARWSAVLPETRLRAIRYDDAQLSLDTSTDTSRLRDSSGANVGLEARLTWRFDRLLYADDEPQFERIRLEQRDARSRLASKVLEALFHWQRAALDFRTLPPSQQGTREEAEVRLRLLEAEAALDVLTNGQFSPQIAQELSSGRGPGSDL